jgi:hypothetical protein
LASNNIIPINTPYNGSNIKSHLINQEYPRIFKAYKLPKISQQSVGCRGVAVGLRALADFASNFRKNSPDAAESSCIDSIFSSIC